MTANKSVIVLAPNGRRQNVKITLNTTILQVLEEVCQKQGYNVDDYDIKHVHRILDLNTTFRFSGLPNNAQLEMVACTKMRSVSSVTIGIQPEDGERIMRDFSPNTTLAQALIDIFPNSDLERAVLIYMHSEVYGREALEKTTLKSLGLNSGKAIIRLIYRNPEQLKTQAHVSTPLLPKPASVVDSWSDSSSSSRNDRNSQRVLSPTAHCSKTTDDMTLLPTIVPDTENQNKSGDEINLDVNIDEEKMETTNETKSDVNAEEKMDIEDEQTNARNEGENQEIDTSVIKETHSIVSNVHDHDTERDQNITEACKIDQEDTYKIEFLGERNALVFNQAGTQALQRDELPDSFFELDLHDAKTLMRDAKRRREQFESAPLLTEAQRQLDRNKRTLDQLNKYRRTVIRIQFPDQFVLQGLFGPLESVQTVKDFIVNYLDDPNCEFTIYTAPPKHVLNPEARLIDENLIPSAVVYYSGQSSLKPSVKTKLTDPRAAGVEAVRSRIDTMRKERDPTTKDEGGTVAENKSDYVTSGPSGGESSSSSLSSTGNERGKPKWFKLLSN
ncbi:tether containing UBX domain for GLUT4 [Harpegnathos saltator]|uniref:Tether containing UBX domain for GLUT4 n=1 Tax=Harpegnathos saltator TaxID=610380 RepID=E2C869_HARSA|nr:tether containing UBX domain for GLUT4 [Harpegnathos saltator]EFN75872.1 Tether containing UBX domain for GLUT4 [Harpegnathos saltator]